MEKVSIQYKVVAGFVAALAIVPALAGLPWSYSLKPLQASALAAHAREVATIRQLCGRGHDVRTSKEAARP